VRYWTAGEAEAYLPRLRGLLEEVRRVMGAPAKARSNGHGRLSGPTAPPATAPADPTAGPAATAAATAAVAELEAGSIVLRDPADGLVDFPALGEDGVVYYLCWRFDDGDRVAWWHLPSEGFAGRKSLPRQP